MPKKKSNRKDNPSPIERLFSGDVGPLPVDNDLEVAPPETPGNTDGATRSSAFGKPFGDYSDTLLGNILRNHPGLTPEKAQRLIDAFG